MALQVTPTFDKIVQTDRLILCKSCTSDGEVGLCLTLTDQYWFSNIVGYQAHQPGHNESWLANTTTKTTTRTCPYSGPYSTSLGVFITMQHNRGLSYRDQVRADNRAYLAGRPAIEKEGRSSGTFFNSLESICDVNDEIPLKASDFPTIRRTEEEGSRIYPTTTDVHFLESCAEATSERSDSTNTHQTVTSVDFLYNEDGERAHLLSNSPLCHVAYTKLAQAASGCFVTDYHKRRKLLNGMKGRRNRLRDSGIKHSKYNKFHLFLQKPLFDSTPPSIIVVPILSIAEIKRWNGSAYHAMAITCGARAEYAGEMVLKNARGWCTPQEITMGIEVLRVFIKDIAESLIHEENADVLKDFDIGTGQIRDPSAVRWKELVRELRGSSHPSIAVPSLKSDLDLHHVRVAKGVFDLKTSCLPDPFLLAVKGAINFSSLVGRKLMPACSIDDGISYDSGEDL